MNPCFRDKKKPRFLSPEPGLFIEEINDPITIGNASVISEEVMHHYHLVGGAVISSALSLFEKKRLKIGQDILLKRLSEAQINTLDAAYEDEDLGVIHAYLQCASKGAAKSNLDLLAQAIAGEMKRDRIYPDQFHRYMNVLSTLTRDEIFLCGAYYRCRQKVRKDIVNNVPSRDLETVNTWNLLQQELVPASFQSEEYIRVTMGSLARTGLVKIVGTTQDDLHIPSFSIMLDEIAGIIDFEKSYRQYPDY